GEQHDLAAERPELVEHFRMLMHEAHEPSEDYPIATLDESEDGGPPPGTPEPAALLRRADEFVAAGEEYRALFFYEDIIEQHPRSDEYETAVQRELEIAIRWVNDPPHTGITSDGNIYATHDIGEELLIRAEERMPGTPTGERAMLELGRLHFRSLAKDADVAIASLEVFLSNYPQTSSRAEIRAMIERVKAMAGDSDERQLPDDR
ncbi:MAG: tetratricopeptide repeat protein, partial [Phycisphaerales bacterium]